MDISKLKKVGISEPAVFGTANSSFTRGMYVNSLSCNPSQAVDTINETTGSLASKRVTKTGIDYELSASFPLEIGDGYGVGDCLASIWGVDTGDGYGATQYTHTFTLGSTVEPPCFNFWTDKDVVNTQLIGFRPASVKFSLTQNDGFIPVEIGGILQTEDKTSCTGDQDLSFTTQPTLSSSQATTVKLNGVQVCFESLEVTITREQEATRCIGASRVIDKLASGKTFGIAISAGGLQFPNETERDKFMATTSSSFELELTDTETVANTMKIVIPKIYYQTWEGADINESDLLRVSISAISNDEDNAVTPAYMELVNVHPNEYDDNSAI